MTQKSGMILLLQQKGNYVFIYIITLELNNQTISIIKVKHIIISQYILNSKIINVH